MKSGKKLNILGIPIDIVDMKEAVHRFDGFLNEEGCKIIVTPNSEILDRATKNQGLADIIKSADMVIPDGIGLVYASKFLGEPLKERVTGIDFLSQAFGLLSERKGSVFLLGGRPGEAGAGEESAAEGEKAVAEEAAAGEGAGAAGEGSKPATAALKSVAEEAAANIEKAYPGLKVAGCYHGYFSEEDEEAILEKINSSGRGGAGQTSGAGQPGASEGEAFGAGEGGGVDLLCVALGSPKQEEFMWKYKDRLNVKAAIGVGGSLDVWSGRVKRAPEFYQKYGLEWLYRAVKEPARFARLLSLPVFMVKVAGWKISGKSDKQK